MSLRTTALAAMSPLLRKEPTPFGTESSQEDDEGLFIPSYLEEALPDDPVLQVKMALCHVGPRGGDPEVLHL